MEAFKDVWLLGDEFLQSIFHELQDMKIEAKASNVDIPFLYEAFNVKYLHTKTLASSDVPARIMNGLVNGMKEYVRLPKYLIVILDDELITHINHFDTGFRVMSGGLINWMANNIIRAIEFRKKDLLRIRVGAVSVGDPKVIWTKLMSHNKGYDRVMTVKTKYNNTLDDILSQKSGHLIMDFAKAMEHPGLYTEKNSLTQDGRIQYWSELNHLMQELDAGKLDLLPVPHTRQERPAAPSNVHRDWKRAVVQVRQNSNKPRWNWTSQNQHAPEARHQHNVNSHRFRNDRFHFTAKRHLNF